MFMRDLVVNTTVNETKVNATIQNTTNVHGSNITTTEAAFG
jgi:hypothetical protein